VTAPAPASRAPRTLRALVVDDSDATRSEVAAILGGAGVAVVGTARDGEEALRAALRLAPDVIVLDLQMPRMDGFTFLRLLMAQRPTPVIVVSGQSRRSDVFKALELGALDFVPKPDSGSVAAIRDELVEKCATVRALRIENLSHVAGAPAPRPGAPDVEPRRVALVGASTGGPQAILQLLAALPGDLPLGIVVAQHMPERFTAAFAERLGRHCAFSAQEAADDDLVAAGRVLVAPGGRDLELRRDADGALRAAVVHASENRGTRCCPSIDRLFGSGALVLGVRAAAVVLTGMGQDGREGVVRVKRAGGLTLAESPATAVVYGMPQAAIDTGAVDEVLDLGGLAAALVRFAREP
jgi:two-component system, chemotaxis family, protein-glutamate methylesterase/glutaminase